MVQHLDDEQILRHVNDDSYCDAMMTVTALSFGL